MRISDFIVYSDIDMEKNSLKIGIDFSGQETSGSRSKRAISDPVSHETFSVEKDKLQNLMGVPIELIDSPKMDYTARIMGGEGLQFGSWGPLSEIITCTLGFSAKQIGGDYGVITAGHCPDISAVFPDLSPSPSLPFVRGIKPFVRGINHSSVDAQFHRIENLSSHKLVDDYKCNLRTSKRCDVKGVIERDRMKDNYVCHTGQSSGISCGKIESSNTKIRVACASHTGSACFIDAVIVRGKELRMCRGDSGGPWYNAKGIAYGTSVGSLPRSDCKRKGKLAIFSPIKDIEKALEIKILTEDPIPPASPTLLKAAIVSDSVSLSWMPSIDGAVEYQIYRISSLRDDYSLIDTTTDTAYREDIYKLTPGVRYDYSVKAVNNLGQASKFSSPSSITTPVPPPAAPNQIEAEIGSGGVSLSWATPIDWTGWPADIKEYRVYRRTTGSRYRHIATVPTNTYRVDISKLTPGMKYLYRVKAVDRMGRISGWGSGSNYASAVVPGGPDDLSVEILSDQVSLSWTESSDNDVRYEIYRREAVRNQSYYPIGITSDKYYLDELSELTPGMEYYYRVRAIDSSGRKSGWGSNSNYAAITTPALEPSARLVPGGVSLSWTGSTGDVSRYEIFRRIARPGYNYKQIKEGHGGITRVTHFIDYEKDLDQGTEYYYRVKAVDSEGRTGGWGSGSNYAAIRYSRIMTGS